MVQQNLIAIKVVHEKNYNTNVGGISLQLNIFYSVLSNILE